MNTLNYIFLIGVISYFAYKFFKDLNKDNSDLEEITIEQKFEVIANKINQYAYQGRGEIRNHDRSKRSFHIYKNPSNQFILFEYGTGHLTITWRYKYQHNEVVHKKMYHNVRDITIEEQENIAKEITLEMKEIVSQHIDRINNKRY